MAVTNANREAADSEMSSRNGRILPVVNPLLSQCLVSPLSITWPWSVVHCPTPSADRYTILNDLAVASRVVQADDTASKVCSLPQD